MAAGIVIGTFLKWAIPIMFALSQGKDIFEGREERKLARGQMDMKAKESASKSAALKLEHKRLKTSKKEDLAEAKGLKREKELEQAAAQLSEMWRQTTATQVQALNQSPSPEQGYRPMRSPAAVYRKAMGG